MEAGGGQPRPPVPPQQPTTPQQPTVTPPPAQVPGAQQPLALDTPETRIEGLRQWVAELDRKLGIRTYAGAAAIVLALAAGIVGVVLATSAKDESATKSEVAALRDQVEAVQAQASQTAEEELASITTRLDELESKLNALSSSQRTTESELAVVQGDIDELRSQVASAANSGPRP